MDASALEACNSKGKDKNTTKFKGKTNYKSKGKFGKKGGSGSTASVPIEYFGAAGSWLSADP